MKYSLKLMFAAVLMAGTAFALTEKDCITGRTDKDIPIYKPGEEMIFTVKLRGDFEGVDRSKLTFKWERTGDDGKKESGVAPADRPFVYRTSLDRAGFVRLYADLMSDGTNKVMRDTSRGRKQPVYCDLGAGVDVFDIRPAVAEPKDFDAFWTKHKENLKTVPIRDVELVKVDENAAVTLYTVKCPCYGGKPVTAFLTIPVAAKEGKKFPLVLGFHGYGASWTKGAWGKPDISKQKSDHIHLSVSAHGFDLMKDEKYYNDLRKAAMSNGKSYAFDPIQNSDPETAYFCGMSYRVMRALEYAKTRPEWNGKNLKVVGGSMGGMQSIWAAALDHDVTECEPSIPWNCDVGGTELGRNRGTWYIRWVPALGYYDTCNLAKRIPKTCKVNVSWAGLGDYICPPTGVFAMYNSLTCPKRGTFAQNTEHGNTLEPAPRQMFRVEESTPVVFKYP